MSEPERSANERVAPRVGAALMAILQGGGFAVGLRLASLGLQTAIFVVLARRFDAEALAPWIVATAMLQSVAVFSDLGMYVSVPIALRERPGSDGDRFVRTGLATVTTGALFVIGLTCAASGLLGLGWHSTVLWLTPWLLAQRAASLTTVVMNFKGRLQVAAAAEFAGRAGTLVLVTVLPLQLHVVSLAMALQFAGTLMLLPRLVRVVGPLLPWRAARQLWRSGLAPAGAGGIGAAQGKADQLILSSVASAPALVAYSLGYRVFDATIGLVVMFAAGQFAKTPPSRLSDAAWKQSLRQIGITSLAVWIAAAGATMTLMLIGSTGIAASTLALVGVVLSIAACLGCANAFLAPFLFVEGLQGHVRKALIVAVGVVLLDLLVVPRSAVVGAAAVTAAAEGVGVAWTLSRLNLQRRRVKGSGQVVVASSAGWLLPVDSRI